MGVTKLLLVSSSPGDTEGSEEEPGKGTPFGPEKAREGEGRSTFLGPKKCTTSQRLKPELFSQRPERGYLGDRTDRERLLWLGMAFWAHPQLHTPGIDLRKQSKGFIN